jgi:hypothetical protein
MKEERVRVEGNVVDWKSRPVQMNEEHCSTDLLSLENK